MWVLISLTFNHKAPIESTSVVGCRCVNIIIISNVARINKGISVVSRVNKLVSTVKKVNTALSAVRRVNELASNVTMGPCSD